MYKIFIYFLIIVFTGCTNTKLNVEPKINQHLSNKIQKFSSKIIYNGNINYLPTSLQNDNNSSNIVYYEYQVKYINGSTKYDGLNLWNPLVLVGFPLSKESVIVESKLRFIDKNKDEKIFSSTCIANKTRNLFQNGGSTEPRKKCLFAVRDNINNQIIQFIQGGMSENK